jgi:hypothetical protein
MLVRIQPPELVWLIRFLAGEHIVGNSYYDFKCPKCQKTVVYCNGDESDITAPDTDRVKCWNCGIIVECPEFDGEDWVESKNQTSWATEGFTWKGK